MIGKPHMKKLKELPTITWDELADILKPQDIYDAARYIKKRRRIRQRKRVCWLYNVPYMQSVFALECGWPCCLLGGAILNKGYQPPSAYWEVKDVDMPAVELRMKHAFTLGSEFVTTDVLGISQEYLDFKDKLCAKSEEWRELFNHVINIGNDDDALSAVFDIEQKYSRQPATAT